MYLEGKQVPKKLKNADVGKKFNLNVTARLVSRTESALDGESISLELNRISVAERKPQKAHRKK